jgi:purine-cytosine permease-like protein
MTLQSWRELAMIQAGGVICLPVILVGQILHEKMGLGAAFAAIAIGNALLLILGLVSTWMSTDKRQSTAEQATSYLGKIGGKFVGFVLLASMLGWFSIQLQTMSQSLVIWNLVLGSLITGGILFGIKGISRLASFSMPLMVVALGWALWRASELPGSPTEMNISYGEGIVLVIGAQIVAIIDLPSFFQHAKSRKEALIAIVLLYTLVVPCIEGIGVYLSYKGGTNYLLELFPFILLAGWLANNGNLYSSVTNSKTLFAKMSYRNRTLLLGGLGTLMACFEPSSHLEWVLTVLGYSVTTLGCLILIAYWRKNETVATW